MSFNRHNAVINESRRLARIVQPYIMGPEKEGPCIACGHITDGTLFNGADRVRCCSPMSAETPEQADRCRRIAKEFHKVI